MGRPSALPRSSGRVTPQPKTWRRRERGAAGNALSSCSRSRFLPASVAAASTSLLENLLGALAAGAGCRFELFARLLVVADEEMLNLRRDGVREIGELPDLRKKLTRLGDGDDAVVLLFLSVFLRLHGFDDADQPRWHDRANRHRLIHEHQDIQRISIITSRRWNESEVEREAHALWQDLLDHERRPLAIVRELRPGATRRFDDDIDAVVCRIDWVEIGQPASSRVHALRSVTG